MSSKSGASGIWALFLLSLALQGKDALVIGKRAYTRQSNVNFPSLRQRNLANIDETIVINGGFSSPRTIAMYNPLEDDTTTVGLKLTPAVAEFEEITCTLSCTGPTSEANAIVMMGFYGGLPASNTSGSMTEEFSAFLLKCPITYTHQVPADKNGQDLYIAYFLDDIDTNGDQLTGSQVECRKPTKAPTPTPTPAPGTPTNLPTTSPGSPTNLPTTNPGSPIQPPTLAPTLSPTSPPTNCFGSSWQKTTAATWNWLFH